MNQVTYSERELQLFSKAREEISPDLERIVNQMERSRLSFLRSIATYGKQSPIEELSDRIDQRSW